MTGFDPTGLDPTGLLYALDPASVFAMFWFVILIELPRYTIAFLVVVGCEMVGRVPPPRSWAFNPLVSIVLAGHNEREGIARCVRSLRDQTWPRIEIVCVDDGSTDGMSRELRRLRTAGLVDKIVSTRPRGGKASALNLGLRLSQGEVVVTADCDSTFERDAVEHLIAQLADPKVGVVAGNIAVRRGRGSALERLQAIEYLVGIGLGRRALDMLGQVTCASGAFSAFRRLALVSVGGLDTGAGEDLDVTMRIRRAGWEVRFAPAAWCLTDAPPTVPSLVRQRLRWERDALRLRLRKYRRDIPSRSGVRWAEHLQGIGFLATNVVPTVSFPIYLLWLLHNYGPATPTVLVLVTVVHSAIDAVAVLSALALAGRSGTLRLLPWVPLYGLFEGYFLRGVRLAAYVQEWVFRRSYRDTYVPARVLRRAPRY